MLDKAPIIKVPQPKNKRIRWLEPHEAQRLIDECPEPLKSVVEFALATGLRRSNIINLEWQQIDMQRRVAWINPEESKSNRAIGVALNDTACRVLKNKSGIITVGYLCTRKAVPNQTERKRQRSGRCGMTQTQPGKRR
ncbi:integrase domain protein [Shigella flexneri K-304]|nr:integrase domain protein [Shigella flexneri K-304]